MKNIIACALLATAMNSHAATELATEPAHAVKIATYSLEPAANPKLVNGMFKLITPLTNSSAVWLDPKRAESERQHLKSGGFMAELPVLLSTQREGHFVSTAVRIICTEQSVAWLRDAEVVSSSEDGLKHVVDISATQYLGKPHDENEMGFSEQIPFAAGSRPDYLHKLICEK
ncbi:hypothetical protein IGB42_03331 [Andreprevotia sp. IGB-42]|nr:hypothetical protein IGB42_03331 [Andreprevotia sp. IGB-42]